MIGPEVTAPDFTEAVIGYRTFALERHTQHNYRLVSPHAKEPWPTQAMTAKCNQEPEIPEGLVLPGPLKKHSAPHKDCGCGIYAYFEPCPIRKRSYDYFSLDPFGGGRTEVEALMCLEGRIEVHSRGMRAERAKVCALGLNDNLSGDERAALHEIGRQWGIPVVSQEDLPKLAPEYGRPLDESARPKPEPAKYPAISVQAGSLVPVSGNPTVYFSCSDSQEAAPPSKKYMPGWPPILINGAAAALNLSVFVAWENPINMAATCVSACAAAWYAGRRRQGRA